MKTVLYFSFSLLLMLSFDAFSQCRLVGLPTPANPSQPGGYKLVFNEEFDYPNDTDFKTHSPWQFQPNNAGPANPYKDIWLGGGTSDYSETNDPSQATVSNGYLHLRAEELNNSTQRSTVPYGPDGRGIDFKSGMIRFRDDFFTSPVYGTHLPPNFVGPQSLPVTHSGNGYARGIFEIRCKMPRGLNTYQAFWMFAWGGGNEIDMFESDSDYKTGISNAVHDWGVSPQTACGAKSVKQSPGTLAEDFHVYTVAWTPTTLTFFFDGREMRTVSLSSDQAATNQLVSREKSVDVILNLSIFRWAKGLEAYPAITTWDQYPDGRHYTDFDIDYIRVYQPTGYAANDLAAVYPSYKTDYGWKRNDFEPAAPATTPNADRQIHPTTVGCLSASQNTGQVAYSGADAVMRRYYPQGGTYQYEKITTGAGYPWYMNVQGDVVVQDDAYGTRIFYKGIDSRVHYFYGTTGAWNHDWAVQRDASNNFIWSDPLVSSQPGALAVANDHLLFYRGQDNRIHKMEWVSPGGWQHQLLPLDTTPGISASAQLVDGDVIVSGSQLFYVGADGQIQSYWLSSTGYTHVWLDPVFWNSPSSLASNQYGSLCAHPSGVVFRGKNDDLLHNFYWTSSTGWQHRNFIGSSSAMYSAQWMVPVVGKISADQGGTVYYRGRDNKLQFYYANGNDWAHAWPDSWDYLSPRTITTNNDNFSLGAADAPLFFQNADSYMGYFNWAQCEQNLCDTSSPVGSNAGSVYRMGQLTNAGGTKTSGASAAAVESLQIYPNPATNQIAITGGSIEPVTVVILDLTGRIVLNQTILSGQGHVALDQLQSGSYTVQLQQGKITSHQRLTIAR
jgi:beta-glucanase (GH16 family)